MLSRYIGFYDKNKNKIHDNALLSEELSNIDLKQPKSNWEKLLKQAKDLGAKKVIVKFESQYPYFRVKYNIRFEPSVDIDGYDTPFNETLHDAFFLSYICDYLIIDNELKDSELTFLNWKEKHLSGLKYKGEDILLGNKYVVENLKEKYIPESLRGKELKLDMEIKWKIK